LFSKSWWMEHGVPAPVHGSVLQTTQVMPQVLQMLTGDGQVNLETLMGSVTVVRKVAVRGRDLHGMAENQITQVIVFRCIILACLMIRVAVTANGLSVKEILIGLRRVMFRLQHVHLSLQTQSGTTAERTEHILRHGTDPHGHL